MGRLRSLKVTIYNAIRTRRCRLIKELLDTEHSHTLLDIGCRDFYFHDQLKDTFEITLADYQPADPRIQQENVESMTFQNHSFDIVLCQQVLEHVPQPVKAMRELRRVARNQLVISVPYEPFFSLARGLYWEKEHLWAVTPMALRSHLGPPTFETTFFFKRYYIAMWQFDNEAAPPQP